MIVPISAILPTRNRSSILARFLDSLALQDTVPAELVICDSSDDNATEALVQQQRGRFAGTSWVYEKARSVGLAPQRNQAVAAASQPFVWFLDDDIVLEDGCVRHLFEAVANDPKTGGVTATIINEPYLQPGRWTKRLMRWFEAGNTRATYASACVGPGVTFMHDTALEGPPLMHADWMGGGCTLYRKEALADPPVPAHFEGGALGEDLAASLHVAKTWKIWHVRAARCVHESQGGDHKKSLVRLADQGLRNRHYIMTRVMGKNRLRDHFDFALMLGFGVAGLLRRPSRWGKAVRVFAGYTRGAWRLLFSTAHG